MQSSLVNTLNRPTDPAAIPKWLESIRRRLSVIAQSISQLQNEQQSLLAKLAEEQEMAESVPALSQPEPEEISLIEDIVVEEVSNSQAVADVSFENLVLDKLTTDKLRSLMSVCGFKSNGVARSFMILQLKEAQKYLTGKEQAEPSKKKVKVDRSSAFEWYEQFIRSDPDIHEKTLCFETISLTHVYQKMRDTKPSEIPGDIKLLRDYLESSGIQFSSALGTNENRNLQ